MTWEKRMSVWLGRIFTMAEQWELDFFGTSSFSG